MKLLPFNLFVCILLLMFEFFFIDYIKEKKRTKRIDRHFKLLHYYKQVYCSVWGTPFDRENIMQK
jgi:hypothetical protein